MASQRRRKADLELTAVADGGPRLATTRHDGQSIDDAIRTRAHELYEQRGGEPGHDWDDWLQAERECSHKADTSE